MKKILTLFAMVLISQIFFAATIKLKITYNGSGISGHTVYVFSGGVELGSGVTDSGGEVEVSVSSIPSSRIDLKGEKTCEGAKKSWDIKGYVTLDNNNYAHLKMEEPMKEMAEASGGFMSEKMLASSYGLVCAGSSSSSTSNSNSNASSSNNTTSPSTTTSAPKAEAPDLMTREESLENQKLMLESKINSIDNKIDKRKSKINSGKLDAAEIEESNYDLKELELERAITENKLAKVNLTIKNGSLNRAERDKFNEEDDRLEAELKAVKAESKSKSKEAKSEVVEEPSKDKTNSNEESSDKSNAKNDKNEEEEKSFVISESELPNMSSYDLKKKKLGLKSSLNSKKLSLKTKQKFMSPIEITQMEKEVAEIEASIILIDAELAKRGEKSEE